MSELGEIRQKNIHIIEWSIKDFLLLPVEGYVYYNSPEFSFSSESLCLGIHPNGSKRNMSEGFIDLFLYRKSPCSHVMSMEYTLGVKTVDGKIDPVRHFTEHFAGLNCFKSAPKLLSRSELLERKSDVLPSNTLTLVCRMMSLRFTEFTSTSKSCIALPKNKILQDFRQLFLRKENCDVVFKVKDQEIHAHQAVLSAWSPVLASTFQHDMREKTTDIVYIEDFDPHIFSEFLGFLYCEDIDLSEKNVFSLFAAADKYCVTNLRQKCIEFIKDNLSVDTFCNTMTLALLHVETELKSFATDFFIKNAEYIIETVQWQSFIADNPIRRNEFIKLLAYNQKQKRKSSNSSKKKTTLK